MDLSFISKRKLFSAGIGLNCDCLKKLQRKFEQIILSTQNTALGLPIHPTLSSLPLLPGKGDSFYSVRLRPCENHGAGGMTEVPPAERGWASDSKIHLEELGSGDGMRGECYALKDGPT